jgi:hypothetical protein
LWARCHHLIQLPVRKPRQREAEYFSLPSLPWVAAPAGRAHLSLLSPSTCSSGYGSKALDFFPGRNLHLSPNLGTCQVVLSSGSF